MIGLTLLTDNTKITTKNRGKNKFQPAFNVKVYLQTKTDKIILSRSITGLLTPNIFFHGILYHPPTSYNLLPSNPYRDLYFRVEMYINYKLIKEDTSL